MRNPGLTRMGETLIRILKDTSAENERGDWILGIPIDLVQAPLAGCGGDRCMQREIPSLRNPPHAAGDAHARHPTPHESLNIHRSINDQSCAGNTDERLEHWSRN